MPQQSCSMTLGGLPVQNMQPAQYPDANGLANRYRCPRGMEPGRASVLMLKRDLDKLALNAAQTLVVTSGNVCTFPGLYFVSARRVSRGHQADPLGCQLVELADVRHQLATMTACEKFINVRCPAPPATSGASLYYADSLASGTTIYTWQTALAALWPSIAGAVPTIPYSPSGTPENFRFVGVSAWQAVHEVLEKIGCTTARNPFTGVFSIVRMGAAQADFTTAKQRNQIYLIDSDHYESAAGKIPATIRVFFHRQEVSYGIEKDTIRGAGQWAMDPAYSVDVATNRTGAIAGTVVPLWDDLPALTLHDGSISNSSDCSTRATARATEWLAQQDTPPWSRRYSGCLTDFVPGAQVLEVCWHQMSIAAGYVTDVGAGSNSGPAPNSRLVLPAPTWRENLAAPDMARRQFPVYPRTDQIVQPWDGSASAGALLTPNADHVVAGRVMRYVNGSFAALEDCWLMVMSLGSGTSATEETDIDLVAGDRLMGRLMGNFTSSSVTKPLYLVDASSTTLTPAGAGATPTPCYAVRNSGSQTATKNTTSTVTLDTQIHRYPDDGTNFTLAGSEVTVVEQKVVSLKWSLHFTVISDNIAGAVWLEDNTTLIKGTKVTYSVGPGGLGHIEGSIDHVMSAANAEIRIRISETLNGDDVTVYGDDTNGYSRLDIAVIRDP